MWHHPNPPIEMATVALKQLTLLLLHMDGRVLLGMKTRGFGMGKVGSPVPCPPLPFFLPFPALTPTPPLPPCCPPQFNGFGGKIEPGETVLQAAVREMREESGAVVADPSLVGHLTFVFEGREAEGLSVHVFRATRIEGEVGEPESDEMQPQWFADRDIPYARMWLDDAVWLPVLLAGKKFRGRFLFRGHSEIVSHTLEEVGEGSAEEAELRALEGAVLVEKVQGAIDM